ncbi:MAG: hypothetical protein IKI94_11840 [Ruminococcus sp.]|nr:hypothetical protein [Ruminococcus sp.]MBR6669169.1 hypothetical protein [Ruminococcus sp.]
MNRLSNIVIFCRICYNNFNDYLGKQVQLMNIDKKKLQELMDNFRLYVETSGGRPFSSFESNEFLYKQEGYKTDIYRSARQLFVDASIKEKDIGTGKIINQIAIPVIRLSQNLVNKNQIIHFNNRLSESPDEAERVIYNIYYEDDEQTAFKNAVKFFGAKYDLIAYLFFIKDYNRYLPIRSTVFDKRFKTLGIDFSTAYQCTWENYVQFNNVIDSFRFMMQEYYGFTIRLIDAHSFIWQLELINEIVPGTETDEAKTLAFNKSIPKEKETTVVSLARIGQGAFRRDLLLLWDNHCSVTGCCNKDFLISK